MDDVDMDDASRGSLEHPAGSDLWCESTDDGCKCLRSARMHMAEPSHVCGCGRSWGDSRVMSVEIAVVPVPQGSVDVFHGRVIQPKKVKDYRRVIAAAIRAQGAGTFRGQCSVDLRFILPRPQTHYGKGRNSGIVKPSSPVRHTVKPDLDKLVRSVLDAITESGLWFDDAQAVRITAEKSYGDKGLVMIKVVS